MYLDFFYIHESDNAEAVWNCIIILCTVVTILYVASVIQLIPVEFHLSIVPVVMEFSSCWLQTLGMT